MQTVLTGTIAALALLAVSPAMAQGVYLGPGGVGVDTEIHPHGYNRDVRERHRHRGSYEGRSAYDRDGSDRNGYDRGDR